ncbi:MAG: hypothetical protein N2505_00185 [Endomicrobia bacterium]|nr:hypothetical protein [Endomicrobiia bacterium]
MRRIVFGKAKNIRFSVSKQNKKMVYFDVVNGNVRYTLMSMDEAFINACEDDSAVLVVCCIVDDSKMRISFVDNQIKNDGYAKDLMFVKVPKIGSDESNEELSIEEEEVVDEELGF